MIPTKPLYSHTISEAKQAIQSKKISISEWIKECIERIQALDSQIKAWVCISSEKAMDQAKKMDRLLEKENKLGSLMGAPLGVKDIFNTEDMPTCMGSPLWKDFTPGNDARAVYDLRRADAIILGKTSTSEFAVHELSDTVNPYDFSKTPGTSSSGSAVAVATGMVPAALGTQTAGSIIRPSSFCGVYGFKPSFGLIPRTGTLKTTDSLDTIGFFARSIDDLDLLLEALRVKGLDYPLSNAVLSQAERKIKRARPWKVAFVKTYTWKNAEPYAISAMGKFIKQLSNDDGIQIQEVELDSLFERAHSIHTLIYEKTLSYYFKEEVKQASLVSRIFYDMTARGNQITLDQYKEALAQQDELSHRLGKFFDDYDVILTLSTAGEAPDRHVQEKDDSCLIWTLCGAPAINLPIFKSPAGMPFGAQVVAKRYHDFLLLDFLKYLRSKSLIRDAEVKDVLNQCVATQE